MVHHGRGQGGGESKTQEPHGKELSGTRAGCKRAREGRTSSSELGSGAPSASRRAINSSAAARMTAPVQVTANVETM